MAQPTNAWPSLRVEEWTPTRDTLHMWAQIVGKDSTRSFAHGQSLVAGPLVCDCPRFDDLSDPACEGEPSTWSSISSTTSW